MKALLQGTLIALAILSPLFALSYMHSGKPAQQATCGNEELTRNGYASRNDKWGSISTLYEQDRAEAKKQISKLNARKFIDDEADRYELVELFYRRVE